LNASAESDPPIAKPFQWRGLARAVFAKFKIGPATIQDRWFSEYSIGRYHQAKADAAQHCLDDQTWRDLGLSVYREHLSGEVSIFAKQVLHHRLRAGATLEPAFAANAVQSRLTMLIDNTALMAELRKTLEPLRGADTEIADLLFLRLTPSTPAWLPFTPLLPMMLLTSFASLLISLYFLLAITGVIIFILVAQHVMQARVEEWNREADSLRLLLGVCARLGKSAHFKSHPLLADFSTMRKKTSAVNRAITRLQWVAAIPGVVEYADWFLMSNVRHYRRSLNVIQTNRIVLQQCFERLANLETDTALASHLIATKCFCWATQSTARQIAFNDITHPLIANAIPLSLTLNDRGMLVTGQNGIGKSTLLRTVGVNLIAGRAFGFCYARSATISNLPVYASFNNEDSLSDGESLYNAELRRAHELLVANEHNPGSICLIDEIFRGTNHLEAVAAAGAVLHALSRNALIIVSSHHVVLAPLLEKSLTPVFLETRNGDLSTLCLTNGVLSTTNGIALLAEHGFGKDIENNAQNVLHWLNTYLAHPTSTPDILNR
jgi:MutS domain V